ncbi:MAG: hypothetical protein RPU61_12735 [Candidatus Sedimenticola sp. (ex Thyasira tokunagai)]
MRSLDSLWRYAHAGHPVSPRDYRGLTASAFSLPWRSAKVDQEFEIEIRWEDPDEQFKNICVNACSRWTGSDKNPSLHNTGFQLIRPSEEVIAGIQEVIREYTFS